MLYLQESIALAIFAMKSNPIFPLPVALIACDPVKVTSILCVENFLGALNITIQDDIHICSNPVNMNITLAVPSQKFSYTTEVDGSVDIPIPGLSIDIFHLVDAGLFLAVELGSGHNELDIDIGVQACAGVLAFQLCIPTSPLTLFDISLDMDGVC